MGPIGLVAALRFKMLDSQPDSSNMGPVWIDVHDLCVFQKKRMAFWFGIYRVSAQMFPNSHIRGLGSKSKIIATKSYADSWWYHLEKCLIRPFRVHLRFPIFGHF